MISIACALYNGETFLLEQLTSLHAQTRPADEVILYDDHSNDLTYAIAEQFIKEHNLSHWQLYRQSTNKGYIQNFHDALQKCHGDIIFLCDQDDIWDLHKIEICTNYFHKHTTIECINTSYYIQNMDQIEITLTTLPIKQHDLTFSSILYHNIAMGCTMAVKRSLINCYLENTLCIAPHDWELNALASDTSSLAYLDQPLITYRIHQANTTGIDNVNGQKKLIENSRQKNAATIYALAKGLRVYHLKTSKHTTFLQSYLAFAKLRYDLLHNKKISNWFRLMKYHKIYTSMLSWKGILVDLLYAFTKQ